MWSNMRGVLAGRGSREQAKGRLRLILAHDRVGLEGARLQDLRSEIARVICQYVEIDPDAVEIEIEHIGHQGSQLRVSSPLLAR